MPIHAHLLYSYTPDLIAYLRARLRQDMTLTVGPVDLQTAVYDILIGGRPTEQELSASPNLKALIIPWAGLPKETNALLPKFPQISVHNLHHNAAPTAELAITLLMSAAKFVVPYDQALRRHDWTMRYARPGPSLLLAGKTVLVLGYGAIGKHVARFCRALEMTVLAVKRTVTTPQDGIADEIHPLPILPQLLPRANAVIICLPHTPETDRLLGASELALLPPHCVLVNIGRGPIVDESALFFTLRDGRLHAAGLDVWYNYPTDEPSRSNTPPANFPFHELDNVVFSPHRGGDTAETDTLRMEHLARLLNAAAAGQPIPNRINLKLGY